MTKTLIDHGGERLLINAGDLGGYPGATVVETDVPDPPHWAHGDVKAEREGGKWKTDRTKAAEAQRAARRAKSRGELADELEALEARVAALEKARDA